MEIFARGLCAPERPVIPGNGDALVVARRRDRSSTTRGDPETQELDAVTRTGSFLNRRLRDARGTCGAAKRSSRAAA